MDITYGIDDGYVGKSRPQHLKIDIEVRDVDHVSQLIAALKGSSVVSFVSRVLFE